MTARTADCGQPIPTDIEVIDSRAPRFNQAVIGSLALVAFLVDWWPLLAILAAELAVGLLFGRRMPCVAYFEWVQPRVGEGGSRTPVRHGSPTPSVWWCSPPPASSTWPVSTVAGWALGLLVAGLALLAATTGLCVGCELYKWGARLRRVQSGQLRRVDLADLDGTIPDEEIVVQFTHPWCTDCQNLAEQLRGESRPVVEVDVSRARPGSKYGIAAVPVAVAVSPTGRSPPASTAKNLGRPVASVPMSEAIETRDKLRRYALTLPGAWEDYPWEEVVVKVNKKVFLFLGVGESEEWPMAFTVKLDDSHEQALALSGSEPSGYGLGRFGWVWIRFEQDLPPDEVLYDWVEESYRLVAPKRLIAELDAR